MWRIYVGSHLHYYFLFVSCPELLSRLILRTVFKSVCWSWFDFNQRMCQKVMGNFPFLCPWKYSSCHDNDQYYITWIRCSKCNIIDIKGLRCVNLFCIACLYSFVWVICLQQCFYLKIVFEWSFPTRTPYCMYLENPEREYSSISRSKWSRCSFLRFA